MKIYLYVPIVKEDEYQRHRPSFRTMIGGIIFRTWDRWFWQSKKSINLWHWQTTKYTNIGDIAIKEAIKEKIVGILPVTSMSAIGWNQLDNHMVEQINSDGDLFVICGGGYISLDHQGAPIARLDDIDYIDRIQCPIVAYGIGMNSVFIGDNFAPIQPNLVARKKLGKLAKKINLLSVRDENTAQLFRNIGRESVDIIGDPVIGWMPDRLAPKESRGPMQIGLNISIHGELTARQFITMFPVISDALKKILAKYQNAELIYLMHCETEQFAIEQLRLRGFRLKVANCRSPRELAQHYLKLDVHVCQMLHSAIMAIGTLTPCVNIAYDIKNVGFFQLMGLNSYCLTPEAFGSQEIVSAVDRAINNRTVIIQKICQRKADLQQQTDGFLKKIVQLCQTQGSMASPGRR